MNALLHPAMVVDGTVRTEPRDARSDLARAESAPERSRAYDMGADYRKRFHVPFEEAEMMSRERLYVLCCFAGPVIAWLGYLVGEAVMR